MWRDKLRTTQIIRFDSVQPNCRSNNDYRLICAVNESSDHQDSKIESFLLVQIVVFYPVCTLLSLCIMISVKIKNTPIRRAESTQ